MSYEGPNDDEHATLPRLALLDDSNATAHPYFTSLLRSDTDHAEAVLRIVTKMHPPQILKAANNYAEVLADPTNSCHAGHMDRLNRELSEMCEAGVKTRHTTAKPTVREGGFVQHVKGHEDGACSGIGSNMG